MPKTKVKSDEKGLYVITGGYVGRPIGISQFTENEEVIAYHVGGSRIINVRNLPHHCTEQWTTTISAWWHPSRDGKKAAEKLREHDRKRFPTLYTNDYAQHCDNVPTKFY